MTHYYFPECFSKACISKAIFTARTELRVGLFTLCGLSLKVSTLNTEATGSCLEIGGICSPLQGQVSSVNICNLWLIK